MEPRDLSHVTTCHNNIKISTFKNKIPNKIPYILGLFYIFNTYSKTMWLSGIVWVLYPQRAI